jgi:hypothetical protein
MSEFDHLIVLWEDGQRRIDEMEPRERRPVEAVVTEVLFELRRRLGGRFTTSELADYYLNEGTDWCFQIAYTTAPGSPEAWDMGTIAGAAFARYSHQAADYGGGRTYYGEDGEG